MTTDPLREAVIRCAVRTDRHEHGWGCWGMPDRLTHHERVYVEGQDFTCACGVWGSAEPGHLGYEWHLRDVIEEQARALAAAPVDRDGLREALATPVSLDAWLIVHHPLLRDAYVAYVVRRVDAERAGAPVDRDGLDVEPMDCGHAPDSDVHRAEAGQEPGAGLREAIEKLTVYRYVLPVDAEATPTRRHQPFDMLRRSDVLAVIHAFLTTPPTEEQA